MSEWSFPWKKILRLIDILTLPLFFPVFPCFVSFLDFSFAVGALWINSTDREITLGKLQRTCHIVLWLMYDMSDRYSLSWNLHSSINPALIFIPFYSLVIDFSRLIFDVFVLTCGWKNGNLRLDEWLCVVGKC